MSHPIDAVHQSETLSALTAAALARFQYTDRTRDDANAALPSEQC